MSEPPRPSAVRFDEVTLKPKVFFPSRTSPAAYFTRFFSDEVMNHIIEQTNLYASQKHSPNWGLLLKQTLMLFRHHYFDGYRSLLSDPFFKVDEIAQVTTCKRFKKILENLHLNDNSKTPAKASLLYDKLYKVRPVLNMINTACQRGKTNNLSEH